jgi:hypothetical protein
MSRTWRWKPKDAASGGLLYEPGNWGDLIKCAWLMEVLDRLREGLGTFTCLDPFAGAPEYPLTPATRRRLDLLGGSALARHLLPFVAAGRWPSAAALASAWGLAPRHLRVFDADGDRRSALAADPRFTLLDLRDGWDAAGDRDDAGAAHLLFLDPYDFLAEWRRRLPPILEHADHHPVLTYVYNRSARGGAHAEEYRAFRAELARGWGQRPRLCGRVAADGFLPLAHHEMLLLAGSTVAERLGWTGLVAGLSAITDTVADAVERSGRVD